MVQLMLAMSLVAFAALLYLVQASQASVLEYNIAELQAQQVQLQATNADLHAQVTALQSPTRIDLLARNQLHMTKPDISTAIWVRPVMPRITSPRPLNADLVEAQRASQPLAWLQHLVTFVKLSL
jgi:cell division protein FtsL